MDNVVPLFDPEATLRGKAREAAMVSYRAAVKKVVEDSMVDTFRACSKLCPPGCESLSIVDAMPIIGGTMQEVASKFALGKLF